MSTSKFHLFAAALAAHFTTLTQGEAYRVDIDGDDLWAAYLAAFPEGTNPMFRVRTEHDGSYDKNFVRQLGNVVRLNADGTITTIWDLPDLPHPYNVVAYKLSDLVAHLSVKGLFRTKEAKYGYVRTFEKREGADPIEWFHFNAVIPAHLITKSPAEVCGEANSTVDVMRRGLEEIQPQAVAAVLELIEQKVLYRGDEFKKNLLEFRRIQTSYLEQPSLERLHTLWINHRNGALRIRNSAIGTLLVELSEGMELEIAVKRFEKMVAPANYKRPTALITPRMIEDAVSSIRELGLESALQRRHATLADISINNVLWADNQAQSHMKDGLTGLLMGAVKTQPVKMDQAKDISIEDFQSQILPKAASIELFVGNKLRTNLVSLTAPAVSDAGALFKWDNGFAWSYNGNIADSEMRQAVAAKGGRVDGVFRFTHQWNHGKRNASLMDLHVFLPGNTTGGTAGAGTHGGAGYGNSNRVGWNQRKHVLSGGHQDVDYVQAAPVGYVPVENITFPSIDRMPDGEYRCCIHNWQHRSPTEGGFRAEIEFDGQIFEYDYDRPMKGGEWIQVATVTLRAGQFSINHQLPHGSSSQDAWGVSTERFARVETMLVSPNHWDGQAIGNKHWFFILEGCKNPEPCRGIYNEFLKPELEKHRKVFEVLGNKTKVEPSSDQLSGVGFSSTQRASAIVRVTSSTATNLYKVNF